MQIYFKGHSDKSMGVKETIRRYSVRLSRAVINWPPAGASGLEKYALVKRYSSGLTNFVETGTDQGDMVEAQRENFVSIVTIELGDTLYAAARRRFESYPHIHVLHGDSGVMMAEALRLIQGRTLFWLDAHYSMGATARGDKETPILKELSILANRREAGDVILIDDARLFSLDPGYPGLGRVRKFVAKHWPDYSFKVESDVICITPPDFLHTSE